MAVSKRINRPVQLGHANLGLHLPNRLATVPAQASLLLRPKPHLSLKFHTNDTGITNFLQPMDTVTVTLENGLVFPAAIGNNWTLGGYSVPNTISNTLRPLTSLIPVLESGSLLVRCKFALINCPMFWSEQDVTVPTGPGRGIIYPQHSFQAGPWLVNIKSVDSLPGLHYLLKLEGGSAITHIGEVSREDGKDFSAEDAREFFETIHLFFSFVRGTYCGVTLLSGYNPKTNLVWRMWGTLEAQPWQHDVRTWAEHMEGQFLAPLLRSLWERSKGPKWRGIKQAIHWYLRSNEGGALDTSTILNHTALEVICKMEANSKASRMTDVLSSLGVPTAIPEECTELSRAQGDNGWHNGPHALTSIRNELVHPEERLTGISEGVRFEAWNLGQWYIELVLLSLLGHTGQYVNRLKRGKEYSSLREPVPWATP